MHPELAVEVFLPEFGEPNIPPVVGQRAAAEIPIERCKKNEKMDESSNTSGSEVFIQFETWARSIALSAQRGEQLLRLHFYLMRLHFGEFGGHETYVMNSLWIVV